MDETKKRGLIKKRAVIKSRVTRLGNFINAFDDLRNLNDIRVRQKLLDSSIEEFNVVQTELEVNDGDASHDLDRENFEELCLEIQSKIETLLRPNVISTPSVDMSNSNSNHALKLPTISLPKFKGSLTEFMHFHDTFQALIINNDSISDIQKYYYLLSSVADEPHQLIENLPVTHENFKVAWDLICNRYHNPRLIVDLHIKELLSLPSARTESAKELRLLVNQLCSNLNAIKALKIDTPLHEVILSHLVLERLSIGLRKQWENKTTGDTCPSLKDLIDFLETSCQTFEIVTSNKSFVNKHEPTRYTSSKPTRRSFVSTSSECKLCNAGHSLFKCQKYMELQVNDRLKLVKEHNLCFNCLKGDHKVNNCTSGNCRACKKKHHTSLHTREDKRSTDTADLPPQQQSYCSLKGTFQQHEVLLSTALVHIKDSRGRIHECRALLDSGSQMNFMSRGLADRLGLRLSRHSMPVKGISDVKAVESSHICQVSISSRVSDYSIPIVCSVLHQITGQLPSSKINCDDWQLPQDIPLADPQFNKPREIDLLLGASVFFGILRPGQQFKEGHPTLQNTALGWVLAGCIPAHSVEQRNSARTALLAVDDKLHSQVQRFWEQEEIKGHPRSKEENLCEDHFTKHTNKDETGCFVVKLPLHTDQRELGDSFKNARNRFGYLERKLDRQPMLKEQYIKFMDEYLQLGHMELVQSPEDRPYSYYLPHHAVTKNSSTTTKLRVVFDASAKTTSSVSLNDIMMVGPTVQQDLFSIVLRFRKHSYALTADIEKMYRQVLVHPEHRDLQRIVWRSSPHQPLTTYRLTTVTYGTAAAPYLATRCLTELANGDRMYSRAAQVVRNDFYVDDLLMGAETIEEAIKLQEDLTSLLASGGFPIRKWRTNHHTVRASIPEELREDQLPCKLKFGEDTVKTLGVLWYPIDDTLKFEIPQHNSRTTQWTKRTILAKVASIFDPLGLLGPVIVRCKLFIQTLWQQRVDWDEPLSPDVESRWITTHQNLWILSTISIPRRISSGNQSMTIELHGFSDASEKAYGACVYLRCTSMNGDVSVSLLTSKSRVAPLKQVSLPRLELCGALLLAQLMDKVTGALNMVIHRQTFWTDSMVVLAWIAGCPTSWKTYVANRVSEIQDLSNFNDWRHVVSQDNPADLISRGLEPDQLKTAELWWAGPRWLHDDATVWPTRKGVVPTATEVPEQRQPPVCLLTVSPEIHDYLRRFSNWSKLQRVTAYVLRYFHNLKRKRAERQIGPLSTGELQNSLKVIVRLVQESSFADELLAFQKEKMIPPRSKLVPLHPFLDHDNLIRVGGRLENSSTTYDHKHPLILPTKHHVTKLIIMYEHNRLLHAGTQLVLASLRQRFWFSNGKSTIRQVIHNCIICFKLRANSTNQLMGQLPTSRVTPSKPFSNCGVDYGGPLYVKHGAPRSKTRAKCYIALFICMATKAIHIELVSNLSTEAFIAAMRRFISRRGRCSNVYSDNGTCFVGAMNKLKELHSLLRSQSHQSAVQEFTSSEGINWHLIPPHAPHFGGLWEAGIKSVKNHLKRIIGDAVLTFEELYTLLTQIEACLNSRPITPLPNSPDEYSFLTPGHFLIGEPLVSIPEPDCLASSSSCIASRWQLVQRFRQQIWKRWSCDYLSQLQQRTKWQTSQPNIGTGTLVLLKEDNLPPLTWRTGVIEEVHPGADGRVRVVSVRTASGTYKRPVTKICVFPSDK